jgi:hypothetical protein
LTVIVIALFILPMLPALIEHRWPQDIAPLKVVREFDGNAVNFAHGFGRFVEGELGDVLRTLGETDVRNGALKSGEPYMALGKSAAFALDKRESARFAFDKMLAGAGNVSLPSDVLYSKEIFAEADFSCGSLAACRAVLARGRIDLGSDSVILRWAHAAGILHALSGTQLFGRASSDTAIELGSGITFERLHAPVITFAHASENLPVAPSAPSELLTAWEPESDAAMVGKHWRVDSDIDIPARSICAAAVVAVGSITIGEGSWLQGAVKGNVDLRMGANTRCDAAVVAGAFMEIGAGCSLKGPVISEGEVLLRRGCVIGSKDVLTTITAPRVTVEPGVTVYGTIWAREQGEVKVAS